jgi:hypothetical protein
MRTITNTTTIFVTAMVLAFSASAQTSRMSVTVPFDFIIGRQTLPAGDCTVLIFTSLLQVVRRDGFVFAMAQKANTGGGYGQNTPPRLIFHCYQKKRFLAQAWISGAGHELNSSAK